MNHTQKINMYKNCKQIKEHVKQRTEDIKKTHIKHMKRKKYLQTYINDEYMCENVQKYSKDIRMCVETDMEIRTRIKTKTTKILQTHTHTMWHITRSETQK